MFKVVTYKGAEITVDRPNKRKDWYITVRFDDGTYGYDGWWRDSEDRTADEAIAEAKNGAQLATPTDAASGD